MLAKPKLQSEDFFHQFVSQNYSLSHAKAVLLNEVKGDKHTSAHTKLTLSDASEAKRLVARVCSL